MTTNTTRNVSEPIAPTRLSDADRALMLAVADREFAQGKISVEEYDAIQERCRVRPADALRNLLERFRRPRAA
jgi:hypothetical protein